MLRAFSFFATMAIALPAPALAADIVDGGQLIPPGVTWDLNIADDGEGVLPNGLRACPQNTVEHSAEPGAEFKERSRRNT